MKMTFRIDRDKYVVRTYSDGTFGLTVEWIQDCVVLKELVMEYPEWNLNLMLLDAENEHYIAQHLL